MSNSDLVSYSTSVSTLPFYIHDPCGTNGITQSLLSNIPYFSLNKGKKIKVTRINSDDVDISKKYQIDIQDIK
jgi:hypothetical protein